MARLLDDVWCRHHQYRHVCSRTLPYPYSYSHRPSLIIIISLLGMFEAEMSSDAWQVAGMADTGMVPYHHTITTLSSNSFY